MAASYINRHDAISIAVAEREIALMPTVFARR
jgi:hypothetical protein